VGSVLLPELAFNLLNVRDRLELIDGDMRVTGGVSHHHLGGHSLGAQVVLVQTDARRVCIPGDVVSCYKNIELNWPMGAFLDVEAVVRAYAWMRANADIISPTTTGDSSTGIPTGSSACHPPPPNRPCSA
jgi:hypothetical protein